MTTVRSTVDGDAVELALELPDAPLVAGTTVEGALTVRSDRDAVGPVELALFAGPADAVPDAATPITRYPLTESIAVDGAVTTVPVTVAIPHWTPVTRSGTAVRAVAGVEPDANDAGRSIEIEPGPVQSTALAALAELGFDVVDTRCLSAADAYGPAPGPIQLFECVPGDGPFERRLDRLDVAIRPDVRTMTAYFDVHRAGGLFSDVGGEDGRTLRVAVEGPVADRFHDILSRHV